MRIAGNYRQRDSYFTEVGPFDNEPGELKDTSGRLGLLWKPSDVFQALAQVGGGRTMTPAATPIGRSRRRTYAPLRSADIRDLTYNDPTKNDERA